MRIIRVLFSASLFAVAIAGVAHAAELSGAFNTGPSLEKEANGASLNIIFHPCTEDKTLYCASVIETVEPNGPSGKTVLPNGDPVIGFEFIRNLKSKGDAEFRDGKIAAIDESLIRGKMVWYGVKIDKNADGTLTATGCLGFICPRKMLWTAVEAADAVAK